MLLGIFIGLIIFLIQDYFCYKVSSCFWKNFIVRFIFVLVFGFGVGLVTGSNDVFTFNNLLVGLFESIIGNILFDYIMIKFKKREVSKKKLFILSSVLIVLVLELTLFNYKHYLTFFNDEIVVDNSKFELVNLNEVDGVFVADRGKEIGIRINIDKIDVNSIYFKISSIEQNIVSSRDNFLNLRNIEQHLMNYEILVYDKESEAYITLGKTKSFTGVNSSYYKTINDTYDSSILYFRFSDIRENTTLIIDDVRINPVIPISVSLIRVGLLLFFIFVAYFFRPSSEIYKVKFVDAEKKFLNRFQSISIIFFAVLTVANPFFYDEYYYQIISNKLHNNINQFHSLTESLLDGNFHLDVEPSQAFKELDNPHNIEERNDVFERLDETYWWDVAYYEGKYYVYFGIVPVILVYLPFYLLTGRHIYNNVVVFMGIVGIIIGIIKLLSLMIRKYFKNISYGMYLLMLSFTLFGNHVFLLYAAKRPDFYTVPIVYAIMFTLFGLYFWLKSIINKEQVDSKFVFLGSLCMALVAGCRPNLIFVYLSAIPIFGNYFINNYKKIKPIVCFCIPFFVVAAFLMYYNYIRFDSIFEFGSRYQLTIFDVTRRHFDIERFGLGFYYYLFAAPKIDNVFPFVHTIPLNTNYLGYTFFDGSFGGVLCLSPLIIISLFYRKFKDYFKKYKFLYYLVICFIVAAIIIVAVDIQVAGVCIRYYIDFMWLFILSTIIIIFAICNNERKIKSLEWIKKLLFYIVYVSLIFNFFMLFSDLNFTIEEYNPDLFYRFYYMIQFWL